MCTARLRWKRIGVVLFASTLIFASLLVFPSMLPWMVCGWIAAYTLLTFEGRPAWLPLVACSVILLIKRPGWPISLVAVVLLMLLLAAAGRLAQPSTPTWQRRTAWGGAVVLWICWAWFARDWHAASHSSQTPGLAPSRPIVCIGDSLTSYGYPQILSQRVTVPVINMGTDGITTSDALNRLDELKAAQPQTVVIELGGHDFLKGRSRADTAKDLTALIDACHALGAKVALMEIPRGFITDGYGGMERALARRYDLELIPDSAIRNLVLWSDASPPGMWFDRSMHLSDDGLHPNRRGNEFLANRVLTALIRLHGKHVVRGSS